MIGPKLIVVGIALMALVVITVSSLIPDPSPAEEPVASPSAADEPTDPAPRTSTAEPSATAAQQVHRGTDESHEVDTKSRQAAARAVVSFVTAWLLRDDPAARENALVPVAAPPLVSPLANVDLARLPDATRETSPEPIATGPHQMTFRVGLSDGTDIHVTVVDDGDDGWRATDVRQAG